MTRQAGGCSVYPSWSPTRRPSTPITKRHSRRRLLTGRPDRCDPRRRGRWSRCDRSRPPAKHGTRSGDQDRHPEEQFQIGRNLAPERGRHQYPSAGRSDRTVVRVRLDRRGLPTVGCITRVSLGVQRFRRPESVPRCWQRLRGWLKPAWMAAAMDGCVRPRHAWPSGWQESSVEPNIGPVGGLSAQPQVPGVGAAREIARWQITASSGTGPTKSRDHPIGQLVGEQVGGTIPRRKFGKLAARNDPGLSRKPRQSIPSANHLPACSASPQTAQTRRVVEPGPPALLWNADRPRLADQNELFHTAFRGGPLSSLSVSGLPVTVASPCHSNGLRCYRPNDSCRHRHRRVRA